MCRLKTRGRHPDVVAPARASPTAGARAKSSRSQHRFSHIAGLAMEGAWLDPPRGLACGHGAAPQGRIGERTSEEDLQSKAGLIAAEGIKSFRVFLIAAEVFCEGSPREHRAWTLAWPRQARRGLQVNGTLHYQPGNWTVIFTDQNIAAQAQSRAVREYRLSTDLDPSNGHVAGARAPLRTGLFAACNGLIRTWDNAGKLLLFR